ncbi:hypothetical protein B0H15DRAFT_980019 [Mycena belliarum]|uniref:Uncharacterized protein n=1 Tax=Mycena belliarum TaxID=1033014 RepID=A0AAD6TKF7_9AGAR|nr:hypothetical protein B0H15DRAFT_980019 [Mycena belliae]
MQPAAVERHCVAATASRHRRPLPPITPSRALAQFYRERATCVGHSTLFSIGAAQRARANVPGMVGLPAAWTWTRARKHICGEYGATCLAHEPPNRCAFLREVSALSRRHWRASEACMAFSWRDSPRTPPALRTRSSARVHKRRESATPAFSDVMRLADARRRLLDLHPPGSSERAAIQELIDIIAVLLLNPDPATQKSGEAHAGGVEARGMGATRTGRYGRGRRYLRSALSLVAPAPASRSPHPHRQRLLSNARRPLGFPLLHLPPSSMPVSAPVGFAQTRIVRTVLGLALLPVCALHMPPLRPAALCRACRLAHESAAQCVHAARTSLQPAPRPRLLLLTGCAAAARTSHPALPLETPTRRPRPARHSPGVRVVRKVGARPSPSARPRTSPVPAPISPARSPLRPRHSSDGVKHGSPALQDTRRAPLCKRGSLVATETRALLARAHVVPDADPPQGTRANDETCGTAVSELARRPV